MKVSTDKPVLEAEGVSKSFGAVTALSGVSISIKAGAVTCLLGDNGAGKSTLIQILSGVHQPDTGQVRLDGDAVTFRSPRDAMDAGVSTAFQDLAMIPLLPLVRNFFLGREPLRKLGPLRFVDWAYAEEITRAELDRVGIHLRSASQPVGTLSGGERQSVAIARAMFFGARVLILDEPTSALGVHEAARVLRHVQSVRNQGLAVIFVTHNISHAYAIGDHFVVLNHGSNYAERMRGNVSRDELQTMMAGGREIAELAGELEQQRGDEAPAA